MGWKESDKSQTLNVAEMPARYFGMLACPPQHPSNLILILLFLVYIPEAEVTETIQRLCLKIQIL
jgi:hypothetical protein